MRPPDLDVAMLRSFITVHECGGFTAAAERLARTQSAVSQQIKKLEELLGHSLFVRGQRPLALTPKGRIFETYAKKLILLNDEAVARLQSPNLSGRLRLGVAEDFIPRQLPGMLARFGRIHPDVELQLSTGFSSFLVDELGRGRLDVVLAKREAGVRTGLQAGKVIWREPLVWFAGADFTLGPDGVWPLVLLPEPCSYRGAMLKGLDSLGIPWRVACTSHSIAGLQAAVAGGLGVSVLGRFFVQPGLARVAPEHGLPDLGHTEIAVFRLNDASLPLIEPLVDFLLKALAQDSPA